MYTFKEIGALLRAVGELMQAYGLCAGATQDGCNDDDLVSIMVGYGVDEDRARELIRADLPELVQQWEEPK